MQMNYTKVVCDHLHNASVGDPIYTRDIARKIAEKYDMGEKDAAAAVAVTVKRIKDRDMIPELRCYQKGIYYRTVVTPFGESGINKERLIADKYLLPDIGYETGSVIFHQLGLTSQMSRDRILVTNAAKDGTRTDRKLNVVIRPPKTTVTAENKEYLQILDVLDTLDKAPIDAEHPYEIIAGYIERKELQYKRLLAYADCYYSRNTVLQLAHTAKVAGE